jgi:hypothetical protein
MAFVIPEGHHEALYPLAWMVGKWGGKCMGEYPGIPKFEYTQEVIFRFLIRGYKPNFSVG